MFPNLPTPASKEADRQMLAALLDQHLESGGAVRVVPGYRQAPLPTRSMQIDPETVLKRYRPKPKAKPAEPQQPTFAQLVDQVTAEPAPEFAAIVAGLRTLAYTVNDIDEAQKLEDWGLDGLITDAVDRFSPAA